MAKVSSPIGATEACFLVSDDFDGDFVFHLVLAMAISMAGVDLAVMGVRVQDISLALASSSSAMPFEK